MMWCSIHFLIAFTLFFNLAYYVELFMSCRDVHEKKYNHFSESERLHLREQVKNMFYFGYDNYMKYAFPQDELNPIFCSGRGPDFDNPSNININDVLGDYSLTLIDTLDTLAIMGNTTEFKNAVNLVLEYVSFDRPSTVQVFEATIRVLGGLLSAHLIIIDPLQPFGDMVPEDYDGEILLSAHDLANRLLAAFENTTLGIPYPRVNLRDGVPDKSSLETCIAGAGSLLLEFGVLSRLLGDPIFENVARKAVKSLWNLRSNQTGLFGNILNMQTGEWVGQVSGIGAGMDSFYEYLLKGYIMFGEPDDLKKFNEIYKSIYSYMRKGRSSCTQGDGDTPIFVNVDMETGKMANNWIDSLQAAFAGVQVLKGDIEEAICTHALYYTIWKKYDALPERFNWVHKSSEVHFYPLRPELVESTYFLYQATHHPFYLHVGREILQSIEKHTKARCGYATLHNVMDKSQEDRMESFFLSETCKYLYLLFDDENHLNQDASNYIFTTEGHILRLDNRYRKRPWELKPYPKKYVSQSWTKKYKQLKPTTKKYNGSTGCAAFSDMRHQSLPLDISYLRQIEALVGLDIS